MLLTSLAFGAESASVPAPDLQAIIEQNRRLQAQVASQQKMIEELTAQMTEMRQTSARQDRDLQVLKNQAETVAPVRSPTAGLSGAKVRLSGSVGLAFFRTGSAGSFPNSEFRVDDAKILLEAQVWKEVYAVSELNLLTREANDEAVHIGELYLDFENVSSLWNASGLLNVRLGRFDIPFGEEYQRRGVLTNPLISHSLSDIWGVDEGVELYGGRGKFGYVFAVQNGGHSMLHDYNSDKAVVVRTGFEPVRWLHVSASAMRTGDLAAKADSLSEVWFASGFFRALGSATTTKTFHAELYEVDAKARWATGHVAGAVGGVHFGDDDSSRSNARHLNYQFIEALQDISQQFYGVVRYSEIRAPKGYPLVGWGTFGTFFLSPLLTEKLERWSFGFGYRLGPPLVVKFEYTRERGRLTTGTRREDEDFIGTEVGLKF